MTHVHHYHFHQATQQRSALFSDFYSFPPVPASAEEFVAAGLTKRPTFFGCNSTGNTPLLIYVANGGPPLGQTAVTNTTTLQTAYPPEQIRGMLNQVFDVATQGIPQMSAATGQLVKDPEWPLCLACAVTDRARGRLGAKRSGVCTSCMARYCWS